MESNKERQKILVEARAEIVKVCEKYGVELQGDNNTKAYISHIEVHDNGDLSLRSLDC